MAEVLEAGDISFFYVPRVRGVAPLGGSGGSEQESPSGLDDVQSFALVLMVRQPRRYRLIRVGRKRLPEIDGTERLWGYVEAVGDDPAVVTDRFGAEDYETKTRGTRHQPAARPAGEGVYALVSRDGDTRLAYELELPEQPGPVQRQLNIAPEARFVLSVRNPDTDPPPRGPSAPMPGPDFPPELRERFGDRRWIAADPPELLDYPGAEVLLIGAREDPGDTAALDPDEETARTADVFTRLRLDRSEHPTAPLLDGEWR